MPRHELSLRVDAPADSPGAAFTSEESRRVRERIYGALRLKVFSVSWVTLRLGTPKADAAIEFLVRERRAKTALVGSAHLAEILSDDEEPESD